MNRLIKAVVAATAVFVLLAVQAALPGIVLAQQTERAKKLGARLMCMCGCRQVLTQCNHVGCQESTGMLKKLDQQVARSDSDDLTIQAFVQDYGSAVLVDPPKKGFSWLAWVTPVLALLFGLFVVRATLLHMRRPALAGGPGGMQAPGVSNEAFERLRRQADQESEE